MKFLNGINTSKYNQTFLKHSNFANAEIIDYTSKIVVILYKNVEKSKFKISFHRKTGSDLSAHKELDKKSPKNNFILFTMMKVVFFLILNFLLINKAISSATPEIKSAISKTVESNEVIYS